MSLLALKKQRNTKVSQIRICSCQQDVKWQRKCCGNVESRNTKNIFCIPPLVKKKTADDLISSSMICLCQDEKKFRNLTSMKPETFYCLLLLFAVIILNNDTNFRSNPPSSLYEVLILTGPGKGATWQHQSWLVVFVTRLVSFGQCGRSH